MNTASAAPVPYTRASETHVGNNFDAIRIIAASMVLFSHHFALTGQMEPSFLGVHSLGGLAVAIFFIISGYLVAMSWQRDPSVWRFALRRVLRIWPALTAALVVTAYGLGAWVSKLPLMEYWSHPATAQYLHGLWMKIHFVLPGVFENNPYPLGVNGSLWTIPYEVRCYIVLGLMGMLGLLRWRPVLLACIAVYMAWFLARSNADVTGIVHYGRELSAFFLMGVALFTVNGAWQRHPGRWALVLGSATAVAWACGWKHTAVLIGLPFAVLWFGTRSTPIVRAAGRWGDPSYGIYLFAFPIQQTVILYTWPSLGFATTMVLAWVLTTLLAYLSWHGLEKQALKFKPSKSARWNTSIPALLKRLRPLPCSWIWPLLPTVIGLRYCWMQYNAPVLIDPSLTYLPAARVLLEQGWTFLLTPESYYVAPLGYLWPALWGAEPSVIRIANMVLWISCVGFLWRTSCMFGGWVTGACAMLLMLSPELVRFFPTEMTEPIFLFGIFGWIHAMARMILKQDYSRAVMIQAAVMLTITLLSRPVLQLLAPAALVTSLCITIYWRVRHHPTSDIARLALQAFMWSLALGLIVPAAWIIKNGITFGLWGLGTGSGIGLYLGTHPLYQGAEPFFIGMGFDVNLMASLAGHASHSHSMASDWATRQAAIWHLQAMSAGDFLEFFTRKLWWWLAHHPAQVDSNGSILRKLRFFELFALLAAAITLAIGWLCGNKAGAFTARYPSITRPQWAFTGFLLFMFLAMLGQLMPILYNARYSTALLDPWLIPLAAFALSYLLAPLCSEPNTLPSPSNSEHPARRIAATTLGGIVLLTFVVYNTIKRQEFAVIDPSHMGATKVHLDIQTPERIQTDHMHKNGERTWIIQEPSASFLISLSTEELATIGASNVFNAMWATDITLKTPNGACKKAEVAYQTTTGQRQQPPHKFSLSLPLTGGEKAQTLITHANHVMRPSEPGSLLLLVNCPPGTKLTWHGTKFLESRHAWEAAAHIRPPQQ